MKIKWILISSVLFATNAFGAYNMGSVQEGNGYLAGRCKDLECINQNIQMIDRQIADLVNRRSAFVQAGAQLKNADVLAPKTPTGENQSVEGAVDQSKNSGADPGANSGVFKELNKQSQEMEKKILDKSNPQ